MVMFDVLELAGFYIDAWSLAVLNWPGSSHFCSVRVYVKAHYTPVLPMTRFVIHTLRCSC